MYSSWSPYIKHVVSKLGFIDCYNLYYKHVNKVDKLTSIVLTPIGEEPNPYAILIAASMFSTLIDGLCDYGVPWDTSYTYLFTNVLR